MFCRAAVAAVTGTSIPSVRGSGSSRSDAVSLRIRDVRTAFRDHRYRTPYKFGGAPVDRVTMLHVEIDTETPDGRVVTGTGVMPLGNVWAFPARNLPYQSTLEAMKALAWRISAGSLRGRACST